MKKLRPSDSMTNKFEKYFPLYSGCVYTKDKMYLNCGGVIGNTILTREATNNSFLLKVSDDLKTFQIRET